MQILLSLNRVTSSRGDSWNNHPTNNSVIAPISTTDETDKSSSETHQNKPERIPFRDEFSTNEDVACRSMVSLPDDDLSSSPSSVDNGECAASSHSSALDKHEDANKKLQIKKEDELVHKETRQVFFLRIVVLAVLMTAGAAISVVVFFITSNGEHDEFVAGFQSAARKVTETFLAIPNVNIAAVGSMAVATVAHAVDHDREWPFVTLSAFQERAYATKRVSLVLQICLAPLVSKDKRAEWESFSNNRTLSEDWFEKGIDYQVKLGTMDLDTPTRIPIAPGQALDLSGGIANHIYEFGFNEGELAHVTPENKAYLPLYQMSPISRMGEVNLNLLSQYEDDAVKSLVNRNAAVFGRLHQDPPGPSNSSNPATAKMATLLSFASNREETYEGDAYSFVFLPLYDFPSTEKKRLLGVIRVLVQWISYFQDILPDEAKGLIVVLENECDLPYTYQIDGAVVTLLGSGDLHDSRYNYLEEKGTLKQIDKIQETEYGTTLYHGKCPYSVRVYPSALTESMYKSSSPLVMTISVALVFLFTPKTVRERLMENVEKRQNKRGIVKRGFLKRGFLVGQRHLQFENGVFDEKREAAPIADLFPHATVLFADIAGFTAWSSSREPSQVFTLLQAVYKEFDMIAIKRNVFKVETIGDSYVAVTGLPDPQPQHFIIMARFAQDCLVKMDTVVKGLETSLGPDTGDLKMRFGMHSGPVTGGVLVGERSRFQLFGDTVNTAARMESTGAHSKIQCSQTTAELLIGAGKGHWVTPREVAVEAKGKGVMKTFWINPHAQKSSSKGTSKTGSSVGDSDDTEELPISDPQIEELQKRNRQIDWMAEILLDSAKAIVAKRPVAAVTHDSASKSCQNFAIQARSSPIDELVDVIPLAPHDEKFGDAHIEQCHVSVPDEIKASIREYVAMIALTYRDNPFHNFEHACHVTMSVVKLLKRVATPTNRAFQDRKGKKGVTDKKEIHSRMHDYTHGIHDDPLAKFAIVFSALIHDADHRGVSNAHLMKEDPRMAERYQYQSVAEQNALDIAWNLLLKDQFQSLRTFLFPTQHDLRRFRQFVVNAVLATDIFDKQLNDLRERRWNKAFATQVDTQQLLTSEQNNLRATIVIEHIIQASDVAHTMQHWHIYQKWNKRLFREMLMAYRDGRMATNPAEYWYKGEIEFFDNYVIPLAKKLAECHVLGASPDESLLYAIRNREEWVSKGEHQVSAMVEEFIDLHDFGAKPSPSSMSGFGVEL